MKRTVLITSLLTLLIPCAYARLRISPFAGLNVSRYNYHSPYTAVREPGYWTDIAFVWLKSPYSHNSANVGYTLGCNFEGDISNRFFFQFGAGYFKNNYSSGSLYLSGFTNNAVSLPFNMVYKTGQPGKSRLIFGAGPFLSLNFGGKTDGNIIKPGEKMSYKNGGASYNRYDLGFDAFTGYELACGFNFRVTFKQGVLNQLLDGPNETLGNSNLSLTVGYTIGTKKAGIAN